MQFTAQRAFYKIYDPVSALFNNRLDAVNPDLAKKLELPEKSPGEYCNDFVEEFITNVAGQPVDHVNKYVEVLYYQLVFRLLTLHDYHHRYYKRFGMDSDNERLANEYISPLSILIKNIWWTSGELGISELKEIDDVDLNTDFIGDHYKPLFYEGYTKREDEKQLAAMSPSPTLAHKPKNSSLQQSQPRPAIHNRAKQKGDKRKRTIENDELNLAYFRQQVRDGIGGALRKNSELDKKDQKLILRSALASTAMNKNIGMEKLRKDITRAMREELFGKIYREELGHKQLYINKLI